MQVRIHGRRVRRSFASRADAEAALAAVLDELGHDARADLASKLGRLTVADLVRLYYERRGPDLEDSTRARYENVMKKHIFPGIGDLAATDLAATPMLLEDWLATVPWGSARKALEVLGPAFRLAYENGLVAANPVPKIRRPKPPPRRKKKDIPTPAEVEKIVIAAYEEDLWWGYFVELTAVLGTRRSETCALRWEDFVFPKRNAAFGVIRVRRAVGKRDRGTYIKLPKSGHERDLLADRSLFAGLDAFADAAGWLFPGRIVLPRREDTELTRHSSAGRLLLWLRERGGSAHCPSGRIGADARRDIGVNSATFSQVIRELLSRGYIERHANARRTFSLALTDSGSQAASELASTPDEVDLPWHPDTAGHRFEAMIARLGLHDATGRPYTLHSLRHFRATHLYNRSKDWVQVAKYLGHTSPAITMELYANNVVSETQVTLARSAVRF